MSLLSYLQRRSAQAILSGPEEESIKTSISALGTRLTTMFAGELAEQFRFGSSTRGTILPRSMDEYSDIDYMVVFADGSFASQTYLDRLRRFAETYYHSSAIKQSSPTIVLELNHIKFDLVPALKDWWSGYKIVDGQGWRNTDPNDFNKTLTAKNNGCNSLIKPTIRLAKIWNAANGYVFESLGLEKWIVDRFYWLCANLSDYLYEVFNNLPNTGVQWRDERIRRAREIVNQARDYQRTGMAGLAESEIKKLIPEQ
jgi:hypothetical protein